MDDDAQTLREAMRSDTDRLIAEGTALRDGLLGLDLTGHEQHGLRPWRTCYFCFRMSVFVFIELPLRDRLRAFHYWLRPVVIRASRSSFVTREWRWTRRAASHRELWRLARLRCPRGPWIDPSVYPLFMAWDRADGRLPDLYELS